MAIRDDFALYCAELLSAVGAVRIKRMFGGHGLYVDELFVAIVTGEALFLKADGQTEPTFVAAGCRMFEYETRGRTVGLHFWSAPANAMDSPAGMEPWARLAVQAALRAHTAAPPAKRKSNPVAPRRRTPQPTPMLSKADVESIPFLTGSSVLVIHDTKNAGTNKPTRCLSIQPGSALVDNSLGREYAGLMTHPAPPESQPAKSSRAIAAEAEAARYALLRRLAPSMRHHLVVNLQPIGMIYEIMDRRLRAPQPILAEVHEGAHKINSYARAALNSCIDVITWLAPEDDASTTAVEGARECLDLLATNFAFRGFPLRNEVEPVPGRIRRAAVRHVLTGALLHLSDANAAPAQITLSVACAGSDMRFTLSLTPTAGEPGFPAGPSYRPLGWGDVQALAAAEDVQLQRDAGEIRISFPCSRGATA